VFTGVKNARVEETKFDSLDLLENTEEMPTYVYFPVFFLFISMISTFEILYRKWCLCVEFYHDVTKSDSDRW
jgi:hypothetical protein